MNEQPEIHGLIDEYERAIAKLDLANSVAKEAAQDVFLATNRLRGALKKCVDTDPAGVARGAYLYRVRKLDDRDFERIALPESLVPEKGS